MPALDPAEVMAIHQLLALYGHVVDRREWHRLEELFTPDLVFDATGCDAELHQGVEELRKNWRTARHPVAHHATNIVVLAVDGDRAEVISKGIGVGPNGRVGSVDYNDILRKQDGSWRIARRVATLRRMERVDG